MGRGWANTIKEANANRRGAQFTKIVKEITVASKLGGPDSSHNSRLRMAVESAHAMSCPKDTIERAIKRGAGLLHGEKVEIEEIIYEGFGPHQVGVMVECQTDNRNRTAPELRTMFKSHAGHLGEAGSVAWMFEKIALVEAQKKFLGDLEEEAIEGSANEVSRIEGDLVAFIGLPEDLDIIRTALTKRGWMVKKAEQSFRPKNLTELNSEQLKDVMEFVQELDAHDDTKQIFLTLPESA